ncbi:MAG: HAD-IA family hydrolase [Parasporobacterium sp.]|nr:HAD-IA family hydrolase [Parasporobacterium sp.]
MDFFVMSQNKKIYDYPTHSHEMWEILLNLEGSGTAVIGEQTYEFRPGTIFCIRPGIPHSKKSRKGFIDGSVLIRDFCFKSEPEDVLVFQDDERRTFDSLFRVAFEYPLNPSTDVYAERFLRCVVDAMQNLLSHWKQATLLNPEVIRAQKLLADHVAERQFEIHQVAESSAYSPNHFRKLFREQTGCSLLQYYQKLKVQLAKQLLLQNKSIMSVTEIASKCGFDDPYYFSRVFKKVEGVSPMQFYHESSQTTAREAKDGYTYYLFDLDGTLTDPGEGITNSVMYALRKYGIGVTDRTTLYRFIGPPLVESFMNFYDFPKEQALEAVEYYREYFRDRGIFENRPYDGIAEELADLKAHGKTVALATSKPEEFAVRILKHFDLYPYFDFVAGATMDGSRSRKADVIRYALESLGVEDKSKVLMVGDREQDVLGAAANQIKCAGVLYGYGDYEELSRAGADYIIAKPQELLRL